MLSSVCACMLPYPRLTLTGLQGSNKQQEVNCKGEEAEIPLLPPTPPQAASNNGARSCWVLGTA